MRVRSTIPIAMLMLAALSCAPAATASESGVVVRVVDGDTLEVELPRGVERIRLLGVDTPEVHEGRPEVRRMGRRATAFVTELAAGRLVQLERDEQADDRDPYDRALRYVVLPDGRNLNATIIEHGYGHAIHGFPYSRRDAFRELERRARESSRGLWAEDAEAATDAPEPGAGAGAGIPGRRVEASAAGSVVGQHATVCGTVASARYVETTRGEPTFLNLGRPYPDQPFTAVIWGRDRARFGAPEREWIHRRICVTGTVETHRGIPQIVVEDPARLRPDAGSLD